VIIAQFDGRNVHTIFDAVEFKAMMNVLKQITVAQANATSKEMMHSGFDLSPTEVSTLAKGAAAVSKTICKHITVTDGDGPIDEDDEDEEDEPSPAPKPKPEWKM
jgi:uncharacterized Rossmann fold enzyme